MVAMAAVLILERAISFRIPFRAKVEVVRVVPLRSAVAATVEANPAGAAGKVCADSAASRTVAGITTPRF